MVMNLINLALGIVLLTTGKKLYWLFVGAVGFVIGMGLATQLSLTPEWLVYIVALGAGILGAILAHFLQHLAISLVGFIAGAYGAFQLTNYLGVTAEPSQWMAFIIGGIVGLLIVSSAFNWSLYILSSWAGATLVTGAIDLQGTVGSVVFFALFVLGMIIQVGLFRNQTKKKPVAIVPEVPPPAKV